MKILHTSDWHLGVKTNGIDRLPEQKKVMEEILSIVNYENIDCVIIAGDVFNSSNPSADAEELFFDTIEKLSSNGDRFIFVLAGNHDDPTRIEAGFPLACKHNIALVGNLSRLRENSFNSEAMVRVVETGKGYIKIQKNDEVVTIAYLPYPTESRISEKVDEEFSYPKKVEYWASIGANAFTNETFNIFVSHLFMVGSKTNDGEVKVGDIMAVPKNFLPSADYTALGHIHTPQSLGGNIYYSGAVTALSVGQKGLGVNIIETFAGSKKYNISNVMLSNIVKYEKVTANSISEAQEILSKYDNNDIVELELIQNEPLSASDLKNLKKEYSCVSNISLVRNIEENQDIQKYDRRKLSDDELFKKFYKENRGFEPSDDLIEMFNLCKGEEDEAN